MWTCFHFLFIELNNSNVLWLKNLFKSLNVFRVDPQPTFNVNGIILLRKTNSKEQMRTAGIALVHLSTYVLLYDAMDVKCWLRVRSRQFKTINEDQLRPIAEPLSLIGHSILLMLPSWIEWHRSESCHAVINSELPIKEIATGTHNIYTFISEWIQSNQFT